jgi:hypothetical protein
LDDGGGVQDLAVVAGAYWADSSGHRNMACFG